MRTYLTLWFAITAGLACEYWVLHTNPSLSFLYFLQKEGILARSVKISTTPGRTLSLWLGWIGFSLMVIMNLYSLRKRFEFMQNLGRLSNWLNFHIFCGILGPTLILFHCGLKVRGLVGISFWSMIISLSSGIIGRYFFIQISSQKSEYEKKAQFMLDKLNHSFQKRKLEIDEKTKKKILKLSLVHAGATVSDRTPNPMEAFFASVAGDLRIQFFDLPIPMDWPTSARTYVSQFAINTRKAQSLESFEKLMGYWHAFHFPFAIFMYLAAVIHIISSLIFLGA